LARLEIVLPAGRLKELGRDGPYRLRGLVLLNNDPYCPGGACAIVNRPPFTVYLPEYETKPYRVDRFE
jgi:hypothetical protein